MKYLNSLVVDAKVEIRVKIEVDIRKIEANFDISL